MDGTYANPIVTPDGRWVLAAKAGRRGWAQPNAVVRVRLSDRKEFSVEVAAADTLNPIAWIGEQDSILLYRASDDESESEFFLCDPATGVTRLVDGDFQPWFHAQEHPLQPTGNVGEVWAAIPGEDQTQVGRYRSAEFSFLPVATYPRLVFDSAALWVDEKNRTVFLVHRGDLLALPLTP